MGIPAVADHLWMSHTLWKIPCLSLAGAVFHGLAHPLALSPQYFQHCHPLVLQCTTVHPGDSPPNFTFSLYQFRKITRAWKRGHYRGFSGDLKGKNNLLFCRGRTYPNWEPTLLGSPASPALSSDGGGGRTQAEQTCSSNRFPTWGQQGFRMETGSTFSGSILNLLCSLCSNVCLDSGEECCLTKQPPNLCQVSFLMRLVGCVLFYFFLIKLFICF